MSRLTILDPAGQFARIGSPMGTLYFSGRANLSTQTLLDRLSSAASIADLRGNFAFVWDGLDGWAAGVDHLATVPLFYANNDGQMVFSSRFDLLKAHVGGGTPDARFAWESKFLNNLVVTDRSPVLEVKRLEPGRAFQNGRKSKIFDIESYGDEKPLDPEEFKNTVETVLKESAGEKNVLLVSGGTDSSALAAAIKSCGLETKFRFQMIFSSMQINNEIDHVMLLAERLGLDVKTFDMGVLDRATIERGGYDKPLWAGFDHGYVCKRHALASLNLQDHVVFTGEVGDQLFGGGGKIQGQLRYIVQSENWNAEDIARQYIHMLMNRRKSLSPTRLAQMYFDTDPLAKEVYEELVLRIADIFDGLRTRDLINRFTNMRFAIKGGFRLMPYSQDGLRYSHPFADWRVVDLTLRTRGADKVSDLGTTKYILYRCWKEMLPIEIWRAPKNAPHLPTKRDFRTRP